ncbi:MAG TPA: Arc family DNA-binding protein [Sideroxyarcus sp.]|nr:Arc family DNA-binding protein [Sideroxyarcus sp.]
MSKAKKPTSRFTLRAPRTVKLALAKQAKKQGRSINAQAIHLIEQGLRQPA